jgi:N-acyl homoserine lactone hydrolase
VTSAARRPEYDQEASVNVTRLNVGWFTAPAGIFRQGEDMDRTIRFPIPAYLLETDTERILIDTGLNPAAVDDPAAYYERPDVFANCTLEQEQSVAEQLDVRTLTKVVLTHLHWDHVGGLALIPTTVPLIIQRSEWAAGHHARAVADNFFLTSDYAQDRREMILVAGDQDLLGDGSVELLLTPGHTPGHQSIRIGDLVLGADVGHFASTLDDRRFPVFAHDHGQQDRSAERLRTMRDAGLDVVPGHDPEVLRPGRLRS